ncbi:MAG: hypothetical protein JSW20_02165 [Nitrospiraceae bacterium]|nr:MAG: hypothetical protein JSW20_02165 [Nitrospiraceae bacterium]
MSISPFERMSRNIMGMVMLIIAVTVSFSAAEEIPINEDLFRKSDYIDIVYANGRFTSLGYLGEEDLHDDYEKPSCSHTEMTPTSLSRGIWIWNYRYAVANEREVIDTLSADNINKIYVQIDSGLDAFRSFLAYAELRGITVFALDGAPGYIHDYQVLLEHISRIRAFNKTHAGAGFEGIQIDVEPYLNPDFNLRKKYYAQRFLNMITELRSAAGSDIKLSFALPFWFDKFSVNGKPLSYHAIDIADEIVIMSYRTDYDEMIRFSYEELCYASNRGREVYLGIETTRLPDEQHFIASTKDILPFVNRRNDTFLLLKGPHDGLTVKRKYQVKSGRLTFFGNKDQVSSILRRTPRFRGFGGYVIHSYSGLYE